MSRGAGEGMKRRDFIRYSSFGLALGQCRYFCTGGGENICARKFTEPLCDDS